MNKTQEALKMAIEALEKACILIELPNFDGYKKQINACKEALESQEQEPVAWITEWNGKFSEGKKLDWGKHTRANAIYTALYTHPAQPLERNFCERCGKRLSKDPDHIHTCTPPMD